MRFTRFESPGFGTQHWDRLWAKNIAGLWDLREQAPHTDFLAVSIKPFVRDYRAGNADATDEFDVGLVFIPRLGEARGIARANVTAEAAEHGIASPRFPTQVSRVASRYSLECRALRIRRDAPLSRAQDGDEHPDTFSYYEREARPAEVLLRLAARLPLNIGEPYAYDGGHVVCCRPERAEAILNGMIQSLVSPNDNWTTQGACCTLTGFDMWPVLSTMSRRWPSLLRHGPERHFDYWTDLKDIAADSPFHNMQESQAAAQQPGAIPNGLLRPLPESTLTVEETLQEMQIKDSFPDGAGGLVDRNKLVLHLRQGGDMTAWLQQRPWLTARAPMAGNEAVRVATVLLAFLDASFTGAYDAPPVDPEEMPLWADEYDGAGWRPRWLLRPPGTRVLGDTTNMSQRNAEDLIDYEIPTMGPEENMENQPPAAMPAAGAATGRPSAGEAGAGAGAAETTATTATETETRTRRSRVARSSDHVMIEEVIIRAMRLF